jgi:hypothetical protein
MGQLTLFLRCWSEHGRHDFSAGHCAAGPNAFVSCSAVLALGDSGPIESWASGVLYDNVRIDGAGLNLENRWIAGQGAGWTAANCMLWQATAAEMRCFSPPTARNWCVGVWAGISGDAHWEAINEFATPRSLFRAQLAERRGEAAAERTGPYVRYPPGSTSPSYEQAERMVAASGRPAPRVVDLLEDAAKRQPRPTLPEAVRTVDEIIAERPEIPRRSPPESALRRLAVRNGYLVAGGALVTGGRIATTWWRGTTRPPEAASFGPAITRFVPGRTGTGYTDDLAALADGMVSAGTAVFEHNHGLWYDRRRDDHERVRRRDGDVWPPFFEMPFARSGTGTAWDGLSRYDLEQYNPWYWSRLAAFGRLCDVRGLVLVHQHYFQHNILEAGAHWADYPWRSANNINDTGFPEPPPYAGDKRIFQAHLFYDVRHPVRRPLHESYVRTCLDRLAGAANVVHMTSAEFTGPLEFMAFWIDTVRAWERESRHDVCIGLSAPKDVQDAILADPVRGPAVSLIDIRYWWYQADGRLYAPAGGKNLSPRQHARVLRPRRSSFEQVLRAVREYRMTYPDKAVSYAASGSEHAWAVLMGGGSLCTPGGLDERLRTAIPGMLPADGVVSGTATWCLADPGESYLVYAAGPGPVRLDLTGSAGTYVVRRIDPGTGAMTDAGTVEGGQRVEVPRSRSTADAFWLVRP